MGCRHSSTGRFVPNGRRSSVFASRNDGRVSNTAAKLAPKILGSTMHRRYAQSRSCGRWDANVANCRAGLSVHATLVERLWDFIFFSPAISKFCRVVRSCTREWGKPEPSSALAPRASTIWWQHEGCESTTHARQTAFVSSGFSFIRNCICSPHFIPKLRMGS